MRLSSANNMRIHVARSGTVTSSNCSTAIENTNSFAIGDA